MKQTCILILGMHRSGTSALTGILNLLDVYLGSELMKATNANKKGYFENSEFFKINEELLLKCDSSWDDIFYNEEKLNDIGDTGKLKKIIQKEFEYSKIFAIKDPRLAFLFPVYKKVLEELDIDIKVILPYRNPVEVASSLRTRDGISMEKGMLLWGYHFLLAEKYSRGYKRIFVSFDELMNKTENTIKMISKSLSINLDEKYRQNKQKIEEFLEPGLKHHNISIDNLSDKTPAILQKVLALKDSFNDKSILKKFDELRIEFFSYQRLFYNHGIIKILEELQATKETLSQKEQTIAQKDKELKQTKETLSQKEQTIAQKDKELKQTKETLSQKEQTIVQKDTEIEFLKDELVSVYTSKSWRSTRILRKLRRVFK